MNIMYTTRPVLGRESTILEHFKMCQLQGVASYLTETKTDAGLRAICSKTSIMPQGRITSIAEQYQVLKDKVNDWQEMYKLLDVTALESVDNAFVIGGLDLWRSGLQRTGKRAGVFPKDRGQLKFQFTGIRLVQLLAILKAHREYGTSIHEIVFDPAEMSMAHWHDEYRPDPGTYFRYHGYDVSHLNIHRLDSVQCNARPPLIFEKDIDFSFSFTCLHNSGREYLLKDVADIKNIFNETRVTLKTDRAELALSSGLDEGFITHNEYLARLRASRFTYIIPAYDPQCFSIYRFIEALGHGCLPLIHSNCNVTEVEDSFNADLQPLRAGSIPSEAERLELLDYYQRLFCVTRMGFRS